MVALRHDLDLALVGGDAADLVRSLDRGDEPQPVVPFPDDVHGVVVEILGEVLHRVRPAVVEEQARLVRFVAGPPLREEGDLPVVGRPDGVFVVAGHGGLVPGRGVVACFAVERLADVVRFAVGQVVNEDVRVGRDGVGRARQRFAGVGQLRPGVVPGDFGHVEVGGQRHVPRRVGAHDVCAGAQPFGTEVAHEQVHVLALVPVVPVADHQVVVDARPGFGHVLVDVGRAAGGDLHALHVPRLVAAGADAEALHVAVEVRELADAAARGIHLPDLHRTAAVGEEVDFASVGAPARGEAVGREVRERGDGLRGEVLDADRRHAAVLGHRIVGLLVEERPSVGRERCAARAAHLPHDLGRQHAGRDLFGRQRIVDRKGLRPLVARAQPRSCNSHRQDDFFHLRKGFPIYCYFCSEL